MYQFAMLEVYQAQDRKSEAIQQAERINVLANANPKITIEQRQFYETSARKLLEEWEEQKAEK